VASENRISIYHLLAVACASHTIQSGNACPFLAFLLHLGLVRSAFSVVWIYKWCLCCAQVENVYNNLKQIPNSYRLDKLLFYLPSLSKPSFVCWPTACNTSTSLVKSLFCANCMDTIPCLCANFTSKAHFVRTGGGRRTCSGYGYVAKITEDCWKRRSC